MQRFHCQGRAESASPHTHTHHFVVMPTVIVFVFLTTLLPLFVLLCQQVLRGGQVFPKKQHDFVSNGL